MKSHAFAVAALLSTTLVADDPLPVVPVEGQPLAANVKRLDESLEFLGTPLPNETRTAIGEAAAARDADNLQRIIDPHVLFVVSINPESRVKVARGPARATLQQAGFTPVLVKVVNLSTVTKSLNISSPQSGPVYAGVAELSMKRQDQIKLRENENVRGDSDRFLHVEMFAQPPMTANLSGLEVEYAIALIYSSEPGKREATVRFDVGGGTQDIGFRGEVPVLFDIRPAVPLQLAIRDHDGTPTAARLVFRDRFGHIYPPQPKRLAPDFFFQQQIYRQDDDTVLLPPGELTMQSSRGPEYRVRERMVKVEAPSVNPDRSLSPPQGECRASESRRAGSEGRVANATLRASTTPLPNPLPAAVRGDQKAESRRQRIEVQLERWVNPSSFGFYGGDHHIHGAGCAHYTSPTEGVTPRDMFLQVKGEGLNVGCVLTWGPCFEFQRNYFRPHVDEVSEPLTIVKYDLEISGFGSQALGHVCLLNLKDQEFPGSEGTKSKGWPTWTTPVMRWAKAQGGVTGYAHAASGLEIVPASAAKRLLAELDANDDGSLDADEAASGLLPESFAAVDADRDKHITEAELVQSHDRVAEHLPNLAVPEMNGVGAMEVCVSTALGACDFISAMDTPRIAEWNMWYHILNCGFPLKVSGETDFPCMSSTRVGQGRVYVQLGKVDRIDYAAWCDGLRRGRSYVSDGYAHALEFTVNGQRPGFDDVQLAGAGTVEVRAKVAFAPETPLAVAHGGVVPPGGKRFVGDTVNLHGPRGDKFSNGGTRLVELVVNGQPIASTEVPADGASHDLKFTTRVDRSSWVALRQFPQLHTNPVNVLVSGKPIRASQSSARWCLATIDQLWRARSRTIAAAERDAARAAFDEATEAFTRIASEATQNE
jgi:hypothetical protein